MHEAAQMTTVFRTVCCVSTACLALCASAGLDIKPKGDGVCILRNGSELVSSLTVDVGADEKNLWRSSWATNGNGCIVWNRWNGRKEMRYRVEVARHPDGSVEVSMSGQSDADSTLRTRMLNMDIPGEAFADRRFRHIDPKVLPFRYAEATNDLDSVEYPFPSKFLAVDGLTFDFNPLGSGDESGQVMRGDKGNQLNRNGILGIWQVEKRGDGWRFSGGDLIHCPWGGFTGCKLVIREGSYEDFHCLHAMESFLYNRQLKPSRLLAFASRRHGAAYADGDVAYTVSRGYGWLDPQSSVVSRQSLVG